MYALKLPRRPASAVGYSHVYLHGAQPGRVRLNPGMAAIGCPSTIVAIYRTCSGKLSGILLNDLRRESITQILQPLRDHSVF